MACPRSPLVPPWHGQTTTGPSRLTSTRKRGAAVRSKADLCGRRRNFVRQHYGDRGHNNNDDPYVHDPSWPRRDVVITYRISLGHISLSLNVLSRSGGHEYRL